MFVHGLESRTTTRISDSGTGAEGNNSSVAGSISSDGRYVAYESVASNLVPGDTNQLADVFVQDRTTGLTTRISLTSAGRQASYISYDPALSSDGSVVAFASDAPLMPGDSNGIADVFVFEPFA